MALSSFIAGFRLAWGIAMELGAEGRYSYEQEQERINRLKNCGAVNKESGKEAVTHG